MADNDMTDSDIPGNNMPGSSRRPVLRHVVHVMGTVFSFDIRDPATTAIHRALARAVRGLHEVDEVFSTYRPDSAISRLGRGETTVADCPPDVLEVFQLCSKAFRLSEGWFSTVADGTLDPSGLVKGWAAEAASRTLWEAGAYNTCVNGGGDIRLRGESSPGTPCRIGIADPLRPGRPAATVTGRDLAVATSGTAERGVHILDPYTGAPVTGPYASVTVTGPGLALTDAYATAAFAMGEAAPAWLAGLDGYEALTVTTDGRTHTTPGFPGRADPRC